MFHVMFSLPCLYVIVRFIWPLPWRPSRRIVAAVVLALVSQYHLYCRFSSGSVFSPEMPRSVIILFNWAFGAIVLLALLQLMLDLATLVAVLVRRRRLAIPAGVRYAFATSALVLAAVGVSQAVRVPPLRDVEIGIKNLPPEFAGYRVLQLTDLHISRLFNAPWTRAVVERANSLAPNCCSMRLSAALATAADRSMTRAAADRLPRSAARTNSCKSSNRTITRT